jgi:oxalate decarboxylase/phosphoglucose isomerase-like protein (cupin superfamily)
MESPYLIEFSPIGSKDIGYLAVAESAKNIPFTTKRVFWSYYTPETVTRGRHAHYKLQQVLVAMSGKAVITCETSSGKRTVFVLDSPAKGLYVPPLYWHVIQFSPHTVVMSLASMLYEEKDYIRDYAQFRKMNE